MHKFGTKEMKWFTRKYTNFKVPNREHARKNISKEIYKDGVNDIREQLKDDQIYVSIDETTDKIGQKVAACIVGSLNKPDCGPFLINLECLEQGTAEQFYR